MLKLKPNFATAYALFVMGGRRRSRRRTASPTCGRPLLGRVLLGDVRMLLPTLMRRRHGLLIVGEPNSFWHGG